MRTPAKVANPYTNGTSKWNLFFKLSHLKVRPYYKIGETNDTPGNLFYEAGKVGVPVFKDGAFLKKKELVEAIVDKITENGNSKHVDFGINNTNTNPNVVVNVEKSFSPIKCYFEINNKQDAILFKNFLSNVSSESKLFQALNDNI